MAKKLYAAKALVNITHNFDSYVIGDTLKVNEDDAKELLQFKYIEMIDVIQPDVPPVNEDNKGGE